MRISTLAIVVVSLLLSGQSWAAQPAKEEIIPLIEMDQVPLTEAIRSVARKARLNILVDPRLSEAPYDQLTVTLRWERVTAREALTALLENYGLVLVDMPSPGRGQRPYGFSR